ncbi:hypothetical protein BpHYR1_028185 [Brachionus plicatilis]|uniref:Secreted protein n=1 Tax=Brachionus plicatilis TaxID=10195 RepID=A0A3M7QYW8_BRAPC|nr:hypothetical protein BpHYR1_028185 [Brachionus plicatilis]
MDGVQERDLLLECLLLVLEADAAQCLAVQVGEQPLQVLVEPGDLALVLFDVGLGVLDLAAQQVQLDLVLLEQELQAAHFVLVGLDLVERVVVLPLEAHGLVLAALGLDFGDGLFARRVLTERFFFLVALLLYLGHCHRVHGRQLVVAVRQTHATLNHGVLNSNCFGHSSNSFLFRLLFFSCK